VTTTMSLVFMNAVGTDGLADPAVVELSDPEPIIFDYPMVWVDEFMWSRIAGETTETLTRIQKQYYIKEEIGRQITLQSEGNYGRQKRSTVKKIQAAADQDVNARAHPTIFMFKMDNDSYSFNKKVSFRNEVDPSPIQFSPAVTHDGVVGDDFWYNGIIYLMVDEPKTTFTRN